MNCHHTRSLNPPERIISPILSDFVRVKGNKLSEEAILLGTGMQFKEQRAQLLHDSSLHNCNMYLKDFSMAVYLKEQMRVDQIVHTGNLLHVS